MKMSFRTSVASEKSHKCWDFSPRHSTGLEMTFAFILALGTLLRLLMFFSQKSLWGDEWFSIALAQEPLQQVFLKSIQDVHPPLYFVLLRAAVRTLGAHEWVFRLPSLAAGMGLFITMYFLAKEIFSRKEARLAAYLAAISPYWLQSSNEIRSYSLFAFLVCLGTFFFIRAVKDPAGRGWRWAYAITALAAVYTEHYAWFWILGITAAILWTPSGKEGMRSIKPWQLGVITAGIPSLSLIAFQAIFRETMFQGYRLKEYLSFFVLFKKTVGLFWHFSCGYFYSMLAADRILYYLGHAPFFWVSAAAAAAATGLMIKALVEVFGSHRLAFTLCFTTLFIPIIFLIIFYPIRLDARYLCFAALFFMILTARGLVGLSNRAWKSAFLILLSGVSITGSAQAILSRTDSIHKEDYFNQIRYAFKNAGDEDAVCGLAGQVRYYQPRLGQRLRGTYFPSLDDWDKSDYARFKKVWYLDGVNMNPGEFNRVAGNVAGRMALKGFRLVREPIRFGGEEGLTVVYLFENKQVPK